jgi:hypothetical protein
LNKYPLCVDTEFAHTHDYADYWGVFFYARSIERNWIDRLDISSTYTNPIFDTIIKILTQIPAERMSDKIHQFIVNLLENNIKKLQSNF